MTAELPRQAQPDLDAKAAALRGASLAFGNGKPVVKPKPETHNYSGKNGALAAATLSAAHGGQSNGFGNSGGNLEGRSGKVNGGGKPLSMQELLQGEKDAARLRGMEESSRIRRQNTGSSVQSERVWDMGGGRGAGRGTAQLRVSEYSFGTNDGGGEKGSKFLRPDQSRSTSFIAANLAASRSASVSPNPTGPSKQPMSRAEMRIPPRYGSRSPSVRSGDSSRASLDQALDTRPIPPTGSLIGIFEQNGGQSEPGKPLRRFNTSASIQPHARVSHSASVTPMRVRSPSPLSNRPLKAPPELKPPKPTMPEPQPQAPPMSGASALSTPKAKPSPPARKPSIHSKPIEIPSKSPASTATSKVTATPKDDDAASDDSFVSASDYSYKPSWRAELASQNRRLTSPSIASGASSVTVDSLANAIVASSLASSRGASPSKSLLQNTTGGLYPPTPPPRRAKYHHHTHLFHNGKELSRTPSPNKNGNGVGGGGMLRTTMRKVKSKEDIDEGEKRRGRKNLVKKHPNKHHEGDRKRWRDSITERERKRYEAVWASNRGLYTTMSPSTSSTYLPNTNTDPNSLTNFKADSNPEGLPIDPPNEVLNLVVRDIFSRSRLHNDVLEEVYALVDRRGVGSLGKEEFVVGLWLIDQRLKGRKLPIRVSESVWRSVGVLGGIKVKKIKH